MTVRAHSLLTLILILGTFALPAIAQEEDTGDEAETSPWSGSAGLSYVATSGNSDTSTFGAEFVMKREPTPWGLEVGATFMRAEDDGTRKAERYTARARGDRALSERWTYFVGLNGERDQFAGYDMRAFVETGATYAALNGPTHELTFEGGLTWTKEDFISCPNEEFSHCSDEAFPAGDSSDYAGAVLGLAYQWNISDDTFLSERLLGYPNFDDSDRWRLTSETAIQTSLSSVLAFKAGFLLRYENEPLPGVEDTDTTTTLSLVAKF
jgi:putative salt-induced outer membrane protein